MAILCLSGACMPAEQRIAAANVAAMKATFILFGGAVLSVQQ